jgi:branched-chain amino acid aminotransferase
MPATVWVNGAIVPDHRPAISALDHGLLVGDGVFETIRVLPGAHGGQPFALSRHLRRLRHSADGLGLGIGLADDELRAAIAEVVDAAGDAGRVRVTVTSGPGPAGTGRASSGTAGSGRAGSVEGTSLPTVIVAAAPLPTFEPTTTVVTVPWRRNEHSATAGLKTISYADNVVAQARAREQGASEALLANTAGDLCEGTGTNVVLGLDGRLVTPPLSSGCLAGVTRELLVEACGLDIDERPLPYAALDECDEAFLTSTTRDVQPIARIDDRVLPACPGPLTQRASAAFAALVARTTDP